MHPIDLYHISQANRAFQTLLSHPNSSFLWTLAFENDAAIPKAPPVTPDFPIRMSGLEWAGLLFGKHVCQVWEASADPWALLFNAVYRNAAVEVPLLT